MDKLIHGVLRHRKAVIAVFVIATLLCAFLFLLVLVNYDMVSYLPEDAESTVALQLMEEEFNSGVPNAKVMAKNVSVGEALKIKAAIAAVDGVENVMWLDDMADLLEPVETIDADIVSQYYVDGSALYQVTIADGMEVAATDAIFEILGDDGAITGNAMNIANSSKTIVREVVGVMIVLVPVVIILLLLVTTSWISPLLFLLTIGVAVIINFGTNIVFKDISFITQSVSPVLQMAVSLDYAIFLLNSFERFRLEYDDEEAMCRAIKQSFSAIAASASTTLFGFLALMFMDFGIGSDLGLNLVKGIIFSYISVMVFLPALALSMCRLIDKTQHKRIVPSVRGMGRRLVRIRVPALILVLALVAPAYLAQSRTDFIYGTGNMDPESKYGQDTELINDTFGESMAIVLIVPRGDTGSEAALSAELDTLDHVTGVFSYAASVGASIPPEYLDASIVSNFYSENYSRIIIYTDTGEEGDEAFSAVEAVRAAASEYYDEYWSCGQSTNVYDIKQVVTADSAKVNLIAIGFILLTLLVTFKSLTLPFILLFVIESAIWINLSVPYFQGTQLSYIGYLVINTVQLGATIDYAILLTDGYIGARRQLGKREAVEKTLSDNFLSILTSALILSSAGLCLFIESSMEVVNELGMLLCRGTLLSFALVMLALPALLMLFDPLTARLTLRAGFLKKSDLQKEEVHSEE